MKASIKKLLTGALAAFVFGGLVSSNASAATMELALVMDGSGSISATNWNLQKAGYQAAFASGTFYDDYIAPSPFDSLWVSAYQFATGVTQEIVWTEITDNASATAFGNQFASLTQLAGGTNTELALNVATNDILNNGVAGGKLVIDISTDGQPILCNGTCNVSPTADAIDAANIARANNITVNALGVGAGINTTFLNTLVAPTGFYLTASDYTQFANTLSDKLGREITGVPAPSALLLLAIGLIGLAVVRRQRNVVERDQINMEAIAA